MFITKYHDIFKSSSPAKYAYQEFVVDQDKLDKMLEFISKSYKRIRGGGKMLVGDFDSIKFALPEYDDQSNILVNILKDMNEEESIDIISNALDSPIKYSIKYKDNRDLVELLNEVDMEYDKIFRTKFKKWGATLLKIKKALNIDSICHIEKVCNEIPMKEFCWKLNGVGLTSRRFKNIYNYFNTSIDVKPIVETAQKEESSND